MAKTPDPIEAAREALRSADSRAAHISLLFRGGQGAGVSNTDIDRSLNVPKTHLYALLAEVDRLNAKIAMLEANQAPEPKAPLPTDHCSR